MSVFTLNIEKLTIIKLSIFLVCLIQKLVKLFSINIKITITNTKNTKHVQNPLLINTIQQSYQLLRMEQTYCCQQIFTQSEGFIIIKNVRQSVRQCVENQKKKVKFNSFQTKSQDHSLSQHGNAIFEALQDQGTTQLTSLNIWLNIFKLFKAQIIVSFFLIQTEMLCRFGLCLAMKYLFYSFQDGDFKMAYLYAGIITFIYLLQALVAQNGWRLIEKVSIIIKSVITYAILKKILVLSSYSIGKKQIGKITNSITEFHDILENRSKFLFSVFATPITLIGLGILLVKIVGWFSLIGIALMIICEFIHFHYANYNSGFLDQIQVQKDRRISILHQAIQGFRYIKMQIWDEMILTKLLGIRMKEMNQFIKYGGGISLQIALSEGVSTACMLIILKLTVSFNNQITAIDVILTVLCILQTKLTVIQTSYGISCFYQLQIIMVKIKQIFELKTRKMIKLESSESQKNQNNKKQLNEDQSLAIKLSNISVYFNYISNEETNKESLSNIQLTVRKGEFIGIFGQVGCGKSTFLNLIASQIPYYRGEFMINGSISFAEQEPVIFSGTIRQNILFGKKMDLQHYKKVIQWSCLKKDLESLPQKDMKRIYEGSSNLSGGQKTRIALARCFYANKDIILLDDPLSSLDAVIAKQVVSNLEKLQLLGKTIVLVTHLTSYLTYIKTIYIMEQGKLRKSDLISLQKVSNEECLLEQLIQQKDSKNKRTSHGKQFSITSIAENNQSFNKFDQIDYEEDSAINFGFWRTLFRYVYVNNWNKLIFTLTMVLYILSQTLYTLFVLLLSQYDKVLKGQSTTVGDESRFWMFLGIISGLISFLQILRTFFLNLSIQLSNQTLHENGLKQYFALSPNLADNLGEKQVISRFSTDLGLLDISLLPQLSNNFIVFNISVIQSIVISIFNPLFLTFCVPMVILCFIWNRYCYLAVSLAKKLDLQLKGPIIGIFTETIQGLTQINIENNSKFMTQKLNVHLGKSINTSLIFRKMFRVYCSYGVYITCIFISSFYFMLVGTVKTEDIFKLTFAATFLVQINNTIAYVISNCIKITSMLASVQRLLIFNELSQANKIVPPVPTINPVSLTINTQNQLIVENFVPQLKQQQIKDSQNSIILKNVYMRYQANSQPVLKNISITIGKGQKIAFIGRTGAGKSSIIQLIYRLIEPDPESLYFIDGQNALKMPIKTLRSKFTCIPQTPFLFSDTLRKNMDPFEQHSEEEILEVLKAVKILSKLEKQNINLNSELNTVLESFSVGEKQLICLARAILQNRKFLILDQATSNIDLQTDRIMQTLIRQRFKNTTIIAVAHRLETIADFDKVVVLAKGQVIEMGSPLQLYELKGEFYEMVNSSEKNQQLIKQKFYNPL